MPQHTQQNYPTLFQKQGGVGAEKSGVGCPFDSAIRAFYPGISQAKLLEVFAGRVKAVRVWEWRTGKRQAPTWAIEMLRAEWERQKAEKEHRIIVLEKQPRRKPGSSYQSGLAAIRAYQQNL